MMSELYTIKDERTVYCRAAMKANGGVWNPVTRGLDVPRSKRSCQCCG